MGHCNKEIKPMRNTTIAIIATLSVMFAVPAQAATRSSKQEVIGVGSGALIGAAAGGPVGFIIGAAVGAKVGDSFHRKNEQIEALEGSLDASRGTVRSLESDIDSLGVEIERLSGIARPELVRLMQAGIAMDLLFRTDEAVLSSTTQERLGELAATLATMPEIRIQLDGFADERGAEEYNQALSERRVEFIRDQFVGAGISPDRVSVSAHGESVAADTSLDSFALERRVSVKLFLDESPSMASNPR
jgi:outer membrane protein OmpA-like peptidoglycan-associated protein